MAKKRRTAKKTPQPAPTPPKTITPAGYPRPSSVLAPRPPLPTPVQRPKTIDPETRKRLENDLKAAVALHQKGEFAEARKKYGEVLAIAPSQPDALHLMGVVDHQTGKHDDAAALIRRAIQIHPKNPLYHYNLGISLKAAGKGEEAIAAYRQALEVKPDYAEVYFNMGNIFKEQGDVDAAIDCYLKVLDINPKDTKAYYNVGNACKDQGRLDEAIDYYRKILEITPTDPKAYYNMGTVMQMKGESERAFECYEKALELDPDNPRAHNNVGNIYQSEGRMMQSIACYKKAIELDPEYAIAHFNMANVHQGRNELKEALDAYEKAEQYGFESTDLYINMGLACRGRGEMVRGAEYMRKAIARDPEHYRAISSLVHQLQYMCEWDEVARLSPKLDELTRKALDADRDVTESPFESLTRHSDPAKNFPVAHKWARDIKRNAAKLPRPYADPETAFAGRKVREKRLAIGYLSHDFCNHPVSHLMLSMFKIHDREKVRINCYSYGRDDGSYYRKEIEKNADAFVDIRDMGHAEAARKIYEDGVDILVDLMGYTKNNRLGICALRPAPVQATWLGFPGGTGADFIDYLITDRIITPEEHAPHYSEKFVYLPHSYILYDYQQPVAAKPFRRKHFHLPEEKIVYCSFNQPYKIEPVMYDVWMAIMRRVENSVLWTPKRYPPVMENLRREAEARGVSGDRLIFADKVADKADHSARLRLADIGLDPRIYNGHATTLDAMWAGVPVVTLEGTHFPSRAASSFLHALGMPELVAHSPEEYEEIVVRLSQNPDELKAVREKLLRNRATEPLFDTYRFTRNMEQVFRVMWNAYVDGNDAEFLYAEDWGGQTPDEYRPAPLPPTAYETGEVPTEPIQVRLIGDGSDDQTARPAQRMTLSQAFQRAVQMHQSGKIKEAEAIYLQILNAKSDFADAHHLAGVAAQQTGRSALAEERIRRAIELKPDHAEYHANLAVAYQSQGRLEAAVDHYKKAVSLKPGFADAYNNMGPALKHLGRIGEAIEAYQKAIEIKPDYAEAYNNLGNVYQAQTRLKEAEAAFLKAIEIKPNYHEAYYNMGNTLQSQGRLEDAIASFEKSLEICPNYPKAFSILTYRLKYVCAWEKIAEMTRQLDAMTDEELAASRKTTETPFINLTTHMNPPRNYDVARSWAAAIEAANAAHPSLERAFEARKRPKPKLVIGYLSNDFFDHPVAHQMAGLFARHDRNRFQVNCYSYGINDGSAYRNHIMRTCDQFVELRNISHRDAAQKIYNDGVDILIDLMGHTKDNRLDICAYRPAPVMVTYLGFPGTTAAKFFDYLITDRIITPESHAAYYSEKFVYMPHTYMVTDGNQPVSERATTRAEHGLPAEGIVFCSFNQPYKIDPEMFDVWMAVMKAVPGSVLWLPKRSDTGDNNLRKEAEKRGVAPDRLVFAPKLRMKPEHLARLKLADIALDTRIYNGHATTVDALWAGVPVITLQGGHFASRAAASFLNAAGLPELITYSLEEYRLLATRLATYPDRLRAVKEKLAANRTTEPLFDTMRFTRNLERAFETMWERFRSDEAPAAFYVRDVRSDAAVETGIERISYGREAKAEGQFTGISFEPLPPAVDIRAELAAGLKAHQAGQLDAAMAHYDKILGLQPENPDALHLSGLVLHQRGDNDGAVERIRKAIARVPGNATFHGNLGSVHHAKGEFDEALNCYKKAVELQPDFLEAYMNMGLVHRLKGEPEKAIPIYQEIIAKKPDHADAYFNLGIAYQGVSDEEAALGAYQKAVEIAPGHYKAFNNLGTILQGRGRLSEAGGAYQRAVQAKPDYAEAIFNLGNVFKEQGDLSKAAGLYQNALKINPNRAEFNIGMGNIHKDMNQIDHAVAFYRKALDIQPGYPEALSSLFHCLQNTCDWEDIAKLSATLDEMTQKALAEGKRPHEVPFVNLTRYADPAGNLRIARSWAESAASGVSHLNLNFSFNGRKAASEKITVGYLSVDFCNHPVAHLAAPLFELHDRNRFNVNLYSYGPDDGSDYRKRIAAAGDRFVDLRTADHADAAKRIYEDGVDILVDLTGHTKGKRMEICALRPAPVQAAYLGYPGSTGARYIDYLITDRIVTPEAHAEHYTERFVYLPNCYMVTDHTQPISEREWTRADLGVDESAFLFCSLNKSYKIEPHLFDTWMNILKQVPGSVLWLRSTSQGGERNLKHEAERRGVSPDRLIFTEKIPSKADYLARLRAADLALDTWIYNGHATTSDTLWAGVPVLTLQGGHFASRAASSLLTAVGLPEMIAHTPAEYEQRAIHLATHPDELRMIRQKLAVNRLTEPLFDTPGFVKDIEAAYEAMWRIRQSGEAPRRIDLATEKPTGAGDAPFLVIQ